VLDGGISVFCRGDKEGEIQDMIIIIVGAQVQYRKCLRSTKTIV